MTSLVVVVASSAVLVVVLADMLEVIVLLLAPGGASLPTAGGPLVAPLRARTACLMFNADSPDSPLMLKRSE